jgi:hypothetical protein
MTSPRSGAFFSLKMPSPSLIIFPHPLELVSSSHHASFPRQDATGLARSVLPLGRYRPARNQSTFIPTLAWSIVFQLLLSVSPGRTATSRRVGSLSSLKAESVVTRNPVPLLPRLIAPAAIASFTRSLSGLRLTSRPLGLLCRVLVHRSPSPVCRRIR